MPVVSESAEYYRGQTDAILAEHSRHFAQINGSLEHVAAEMHILALAVQGLTLAAEADRTLARETAAALKAADEARRNNSDSAWTPMQRALAVVAVLATLLGVLWGIFHH